LRSSERQVWALKKVSFSGGIHPLHAQHEGKSATAGVPVRPFVSDRVCIPMDMHLGAPSKPLVKKGDKVLMGQVIAEAVGGRGIPVHASISGTVTAVEPRQQLASVPSMCISIENDFADEWVELSGLGAVETAPADQIIPAIQAAGICGMGGACFPTHAKLMLPPGKTVDTILLNGAECETFLTSDHRLMLENAGRVVDGLRAVMRAMDVDRGVIAIEDNKPDAIAAVQKASQGRAGVEVAVMITKYPQGGEKQLIDAVLKRQVPSGGLPMDVHVVVLNVGTAAAIADAVIEGKPLIQRITTITGAVQEPANLLLRIGTLFADAITAAGGYRGEPGKIFAGGSMTGTPAPDDNVSMTKATNGIVVLTPKQAETYKQQPCIRCGRCVSACPARLMPYRLMALCEKGDLETAQNEHLKDCTLCGSCSYVCPARRWMTASFKDAKVALARRK
jgi:electron transport complex protein RnfC